VAVAGVAAALALGSTAPAAGAPRGQPDLRVTRVSASPEYEFKGEQLRMSILYRIANAGGRSAGPSRTAFLLKHGNRLFRLGVRREPRTPAPAPGINQIAAFNLRNNFPAGDYKVGVCADVSNKVAESREGNNCRTAKKKFYSTYRTWRGTFAGARPKGGLFGSDLSWSTPSRTTFGPPEYIGFGLFRWPNNGAGSIKYTNRGNSGGCSYSGTGTFAIDARFSNLMVGYSPGRYTAFAATIPGSKFSVQQNCNGTLRNFDLPVGSTPALTAIKTSLPFGTQVLDGRSTVPGTNTRYSWDLAGR
jgi:hypothetical protein